MGTTRPSSLYFSRDQQACAGQYHHGTDDWRHLLVMARLDVDRHRSGLEAFSLSLRDWNKKGGQAENKHNQSDPEQDFHHSSLKHRPWLLFGSSRNEFHVQFTTLKKPELIVPSLEGSHACSKWRR